MSIIKQGVFQAPNLNPSPTLRTNSCYLISKISISEWTQTETRFITDNIKANKNAGAGKEIKKKNVERKESDHNQVAHLRTSAYTLILTLTLSE